MKYKLNTDETVECKRNSKSKETTEGCDRHEVPEDPHAHWEQRREYSMVPATISHSTKHRICTWMLILNMSRIIKKM